MLDIRQGLGRRDFLRIGGLLPLGMSMGHLLAAQPARARAKSVIGAMSDEELNERMPDDDAIMRGARKSTIVQAIVDHTAHHRGALTVYTRLLGKTPPMPYME